MEATKVFKYFSFLNLLLFGLFLVLQIIQPLKTIHLFSYTLVFAVAAYSCFTLSIFFMNNAITSKRVLKFGAILLFLSPVVLMIYQLIGSSDFLEFNWPILLALSMFQGGLAILNLLDFFSPHKKITPLLNLGLLSTGLITLFFLIIILNKEIHSILFNIMIGLMAFMSLIVIVGIVKEFKS